jgi:uncharacterized alpha-E superfamily protein
MLSRVADNLYWMSRYLERAEHISRLLAVKLETMIEQSPHDADASWRRVLLALSSDAFVPSGPIDAFQATEALVFLDENPSSLISSLALARENARQVREQISTEMWNRLNFIHLKFAPMDAAAIWNEQSVHPFRDIIAELHMLDGITYSTMRHGEGWDFLQLGRYIERAQLVTRLLDIHFGPASYRCREPGALDWIILLRFCTGFEAYCKVYTASIRRERIAEFLLFDQEFPHSVRFAVERLVEALGRVGIGAPTTRRALCERLSGKLKASMDFGHIGELIGGSIEGFLADISLQCERIHNAVYTAYIAYDAEATV